MFCAWHRSEQSFEVKLLEEHGLEGICNKELGHGGDEESEDQIWVSQSRASSQNYSAVAAGLRTQY